MTALLFNPSSLFILLLALFSFHQHLWDFSDYYVLNASIYSEARDPSYSVILLRLKKYLCLMRCSQCLISLPSFTLHDVSRTKWLWITLWASTKAQSDFLFAFLFFFFYIRAPHCGSCHSMEKVEIFFDMLSFCLDVVRCSTCDITCIMYQRQLSYVNSFFGPNSLHFWLNLE